MALRHFFLILMVVSIWAFNNIAIKWGLHDLPPLLMTTLRFVVVALILVPFTRVSRQQLRYLVPLAFTFGFMHFSLLFVSLNHTDAGTAAVIVQLGTPIAMLLAMLILKEKLRLVQLLGITISLSGVVVLAGSPTIPNWWVLVLLLLSALGWAVSNMIVKKSPPISPLTMTGWLSFLAIPIVASASWLTESDQLNLLLHSSWRGWFGILFSAIGSSIVAYSLWYSLLKNYNVNLIMPYSLLTPVLAVIMGVVVLGDSMNSFKVTGGLLVIIGTAIAVINLRNLKMHARLSRFRLVRRRSDRP
ncbi:multidrug DMT transporter permease [bacteria symbiont BFo1 of Frankliniella occidentalis]|uniref:DMT family transporter n=1 Tax=Erwinia aphidicola TaxID=68334 RepID=UPI0006647492|nr:EamA family transporter [Erwinia aphidicola]KMV71141.1 multidrug DMT transporter permease [bacteria symbiont BFo1 of Frankliniella occidentalis]PIJ55593.1 EamA family transporter [Erwinia sp. OLMDLW33]KYP85161.1 multidrug DMT transporter permease [bacteria symbiont BFo1 of Frankliniella occidentalis]KYP91158.1 multidrug DMT transporter permease [bacteria symbiont BFo1 of Frankliniella occidentalis]CAH0278423.1 putative amino-acid metabolite efflux pump [Erwinia aphidicola]